MITKRASCNFCRWKAVDWNGKRVIVWRCLDCGALTEVERK